MTNSNGEKPSMEELKGTIKEYVLKEFLPGENPSELTDSTPHHYRRNPGFTGHPKACGIPRGTVSHQDTSA